MRLKIGGHIPWREKLNLLETDSECDDEGFDDLLEAMEEGGGGVGVSSFRRVPVAPVNLQRTSSNNWDADFASAQARARSVMANFK